MLPSLGGLMSDPVVLGGAGGIILLLLGLLFVRRKKSNDDDGITVAEGDELVDDDATPIHPPGVDEQTDTDLMASLGDTGLMDTEQVSAEDLAPAEEAPAVEDEFSQTAVLSADEIPQPEAAAEAEQDDVLNEVDVYLAYGLYENAEDLLKESIQNQPDRADYRAKLLDTYFATKNGDAFVKEAESLKSLGWRIG